MYSNALADFDAHCRKHKLRLSPPSMLARSFVHFFESVARTGLSPAKGRNALYGFLKLRAGNHRHMAAELDPAAQALKGWARLVRDVIKDPVPESIFFWLLEAMTDAGAGLYATAGLISFDTYCRPSEALALDAADVIRPRAAAGRGYARWVIHFAPADRGMFSKTRQQDDSVIAGIGPRGFMTKILAAALRARPSGPLFAGCSLFEYERAMQVAVGKRQLGALNITPHSARHSGPSNDFLQGRVDLKGIQKRGRWETLTSVRRYEKNAKLMRQIRKCSDQQLKASDGSAARLAQKLLRFWSWQCQCARP